MTPTFDADSYTQLLVKYQPKVIKTEAENDRIISLAEALEHKPDRTLEEAFLLELLVLLVERFEAEHYPIPERSPHSVLHHLMEENSLKQADLVGVLGSRGVVSEVVNGKRALSKTQAMALAGYFNVDVGLFIG